MQLIKAPHAAPVSATRLGLIVKGITLGTVLTLSACASTQVLRDFTTDGCSLFPDGDAVHPMLWSDCCVNHDMAYWRGGTEEERINADVALRDCVLARTNRPTLAAFMYRGVRLGGMPVFPTGFRWGYGWGYGRGYEVLTADEQKQADAELMAYRLSHPKTSCE